MGWPSMRQKFLHLVWTISVVSAGSARAGDWPQWRGPNRDGKSPETGLPSTWTPGPGGSGNVIWRQSTRVGDGGLTSSNAQDAGSLVVVGSGASGQVFFMHSMASSVSSRTVCLRESDGGFLWDYRTNVYGGDGFSYCPNYQGAATPCVDAASQRLYTGTKEGRLLCLDFSGNRIWRRLSGGGCAGSSPFSHFSTSNK